MERRRRIFSQFYSSAEWLSRVNLQQELSCTSNSIPKERSQVLQHLFKCRISVPQAGHFSAAPADRSVDGHSQCKNRAWQFPGQIQGFVAASKKGSTSHHWCNAEVASNTAYAARHQWQAKSPLSTAKYSIRTFQRCLSSSSSADMYDSLDAPREHMEYDVVIVGAGPAGLAAAIRLKQIASERGQDINVCVVEKGAEVGSHIISGNVFETRALDELLPDWKERNASIRTPVTQDRFLFLTEKRHFTLPSPFSNHNNYVISLSELVRWLGQQAEELGVEIYPGFAASEVLMSVHGRVEGIATNDMGIAKDGSPKPSFQRGMELRGGLTLFAEGCRGFLSEEIIKLYDLRGKAGAQHQTYALGIKEVWEVEESKHRPGEVVHTVGYPLDHSTYGGSFLYHMDNRQVALGLVVALDYKNPYLSPYEEFNRWKQHPAIRGLLEGGSVVEYGARTLNEGGLQSVPELAFPGGALIGCSAGFLNVPKIKGTHTAMKSGMLAAETAYSALTSGNKEADMAPYSAAMRQSWVWEELRRARNIRPGFHWGMWPGIANAGWEHYVTRGRSPWTLRHGKPDHQTLLPAESCKPVQYPKPDGRITFDLLTSLHRSSTNHDHDQPSHLLLLNRNIPTGVNLPKYGGPEARYCPARVYEYVADDKGTPQLQINAQNCLHCKACSIKDPQQNIRWTVPEGGGGPGYSVM